MMVDLAEEHYSVDEMKDRIDEISPNEEVPVVHQPPVQHPDVS